MAVVRPDMIDNNYRAELRTPELRMLAYESYCDHVSSGQPKQSWHFKHPKAKCCWKTMEKYIRDYPDELPTVLMKEAESKRLRYWLDKGEKLMMGEYKGGSPVVWQTIMRNIFKDIGWDRDIQTQGHDPELARQYASLMMVLQNRQQKSDSPQQIEQIPSKDQELTS